ncbi:putative odorant receptor 92a [Plutella xylostella]|uniref:putative odorant receptor 92a n=1 Tax=Plutella xylostella TaxID=51655 RepID=UPI0020321CE4|nr:putative odorant receptor 92a [Plutella xylostella]
MSATEKFDHSLYRTKMALLASGIKFSEGNMNKFLDHIINYWLFYFNCFWLYMDVIGELIWTYEGIQEGRSFEEISVMAPCITVCLLATAKSMPLYLQRGILTNVVKELREIHPDTDGDESEDDDGERRNDEDVVVLERDIAKAAIKHFDSIMQLFLFLCVSVFTFFCLLPLLLMVYQRYTTGVAEVQFPFSVKYFFDIDVNSSSIWPIVYFHQVVSTLIVSLNVYGSDSLFYACCNFIQMHFRILQCQIEFLIGRQWGPSDSHTLNEKFKGIVRRHQGLTEIVRQLEFLYSYSSLFNFVTSSFLICLSGFIVTTSKETRLVLCFVTFLFMSLAQISIFCYGGDLIMQSSKDVSAAVYRSRWFVADERLKRSMFIVLARAQRPCKLTAANFADLNLSAFATVLRRSWSYFALLKTMNDQ